MILDERTEIADAVTLPTTGPATVLVGDVIDLTVARNLAGGGVQMYCVITVDTAIDNAAAGTVEFKLVSDAQEAIAVDGSATVHGTTGALVKAKTVAGKQFVIPLPPEGSIPYERYLGVICTDAGSAITAGKVNINITDKPPQIKAYDDGR